MILSTSNLIWIGKCGYCQKYIYAAISVVEVVKNSQSKMLCLRGEQLS